MPIHLEPYQSAWDQQFVKLKSTLAAALHPMTVDIQHVGSTALPGMLAKPILDIDIIISEKDLLVPVSYALEHLGYKNRGDQGIPGRFAFRQTAATTPDTGNGVMWTEHHLYVCYSDSLALRNHLLFRDTLLSNALLMRQYADLKSDLSAQPGITREIYTQRKTDFIISVLRGGGLDTDELDQIKSENIIQ